MKNLKFLIKTVAFMLIAININAQSSVSLNLNLMPPYNPRIFNYLKNENKALITVVNNTNTTQNIKFIGSIKGDNGISISTKKEYTPSSPLTLFAYQSKVLTSATGSMDFLADKNFVDIDVDEKIKVAVIKDGILPEGNYTFCVQALDYNTNQPLSIEVCWPIVISYIQPPVVITPIDESDISTNLPQFSWSPAVGNVSSGNIRYDLYILKLTEGQNPYDAMQQALNYNVGNPLKKTDLFTPNYIYSVSDWPLEDSATYAVQVIAKDLNNLLYFANNGKSEVSTFSYVSQTITTTPPPPAESDDFQCACNIPLPTGSAKTDFTVSQNDQFQIGNYTLTVTNITSQPDNQGYFSGEGTIPYPLNSGVNIPLSVTFSNLLVNQSDIAIEGSATANVNTDASFIPENNTSETDLTVSTSQALDLQNYFNTHPTQLLSSAQNNPGSTINLPLGINKMVDGESKIVAITGMYFTSEKAAFDAITAINIPDATPSVIGFGQKYICLDANNICNTQGVLSLSQDLTLNMLTGDGTLILKGKNSMGGSAPADSGSYVIFDKTGFLNFRIHAEYAFPQNVIVQEDNTSQVTASIAANATSWGDWIGEVTFNSSFKAPEINDFVYHPVLTYYDHSDAQNPTGIPALYTTNDPLGNQPQWHGFVMSTGNADFPGQDLTVTVDNAPVSINISGLIIDEQGVTADIDESSILSITNGKIDGWRFSIDNINVSILKNALTEGDFTGKMLLPIAHDTSFVDYSCLLNMDNGNFSYQFALQERDNLKVPMWKAKMDIEQSSSITVEINSGMFNATADLNGSFDIDGNLDQLKKLKLKNVEFQNMTINSSADNLDVGTLSKGSSTDESKISGFVLDVKSISVVPGSEPVIQFNSEIELVKFVSLPLAETNFKVFGKKTTATSGRSFYDFDKGVIDSLKIKGDLSAFKINAVLCFYKDDQTYGDGFRGTATVEVPKVVTVTCKAQFGSIENSTSDYKYWYFDAFAELANGVAMFPPYVYGYGFGGGAYYHMQRDTTSKKSEIVTDDPSNYKNTNTAPSGITYIPNENISLGLKAMILFGLQERKTFNADVNLEMDFTASEGINTFYMDGNARVLAKDNKSKEAMVTGSLSVYYDFQNDIFHADLTGNLNLKTVTATVPSQFHFAPDGWYIYMGRPRPEQGCTLNIASLFALTAYFEAGTILDPVPSIPQDVLTVLNTCGVNTSFLTRQNTALINGGRGIIFGADMEFHYSGTFLIIKGSLDAHAGFDFSLQQTDYSCDGSGDPAGINGWYAMGQLYASLEVKLSIHVDLSFYELDVKILEAMAGAVLMGGGTNPTWIEGAIGGHFRILDGLIEGNFSYHFSHGDKCVTQSSDVLESLDLISDIYPSDEENTDISIDIFPTVVTNLRITSSTFTLDQMDHDNGTVTQRIFRFNPDNVTYRLRKTASTSNLSCGKIMNEDGFGFTLNPQTILSPLTEYELIIYATVDEYINGQWQRAQRENGTEFVESDSVIFNTDQGIQKLAEENIKYTIPFDRQRNFLPQGFASGKIDMIQNMDFNAFALPVDPTEYDIEYIAEFIPLGNSTGQNMETPVTLLGSTFSFDIPSEMQPSTIYCMQFKARWTPKQTSSQPFQLMQLTALNIWTGDGTDITQSKREINQEKLVIAKNEQLLYDFYFRTSDYSSYTEKFNDMEIGEIVFDTRYSLQSENEEIYNTQFVYVTGDDLQDNSAMMSKLRQDLNVSTNQEIQWVYPHAICLQGEEQFDDYEVNGYSKQNKTGNTYTTDPVITLDEWAVESFASSLYHDLTDILTGEGAIELVLPGYTSEIGGWVFTKEISSNTAPLLSDNEIFDGVEMLYFPPYSKCKEIMSTNVITEPPAGNTSSGMTYSMAGTYIPINLNTENNSQFGISQQYSGTVFKNAMGNTMQSATLGIGSKFDYQQFQLPDKVNVFNVVYRYNYSAGRGLQSIPNQIIGRALGYTDPSPEIFADFFGNVAQGFDMVTESLNNVSVGSFNVSATANANMGALGGQVNINAVGF